MASNESSGTTTSFIGGLIIGLIVSAPVAAWLSPRSGRALRSEIRQRGILVRRQAGAVVRKPVEKLQSQVDQIRGESVEESLAEGRALARKRTDRTGRNDHNGRNGTDGGN